MGRGCRSRLWVVQGVTLRLADKVAVAHWVEHDQEVDNISGGLERTGRRLMARIVQRKTIDF